MINKKLLSAEIAQLSSLLMLTQAYEEIASARMKRTRATVLAKRDFLEEINLVFEEVKNSYIRKAVSLAKKRKKRAGKVTFLAHNGKTVAVFLSANTGLYGNIVPQVFNAFLKEVRSTGSEVTIVGRYGLNMFLQEEPKRSYTFFDLSDHKMASKEIEAIVKHIVGYEKIYVYYGKFINVVKQAATVLAVNAEIDLDQKKTTPRRLYLFEPTLEKILMFFETEIFTSLFEQSVSEGRLAKYASRVMAMDKAAENIQEYLEGLKLEKLKLRHRDDNRKQLNSLSGVVMRNG